ncbi:nitroreductase family protein [Draconibacterium halophilum]|uniref:NADPH-dependent oxidoreductase n=1 Tax=Draconibacterium halophilum TaxID=2706887 RepID=A0A6C0RJN6_9BACT|nr:nitroreductase family protein [Draconibacterium halophilum]QIA09411.1 NADPH-dependent oxidoreductase [Draconibacterium halophilum]
MELLNKHVSIRNFSDKVVDPDLLKSIIYSGTRASTTGNMQLYSVIITKDSKRKEKLLPLHFNQPVAKNAPVLLTFVADFNRFSKWCLFNEAQPGYNNLISFTNALIDTSLAAQNVCVAAENNGLGICYLGTTAYNAKEHIELLELPQLTFPVTTVALGYPEERPELTDRIPLKGIIHDEVYKDYDKAQIDELYAFKESLESSNKFVAENNKQTLAQVFTDVRYKKDDNEFFSEKMMNTLRDQEFFV